MTDRTDAHRPEAARRRRVQVALGAASALVITAVVGLWWLRDDTTGTTGTVALIPTAAMVDASEPISHLVTGTDQAWYDGLIVTRRGDDDPLDRVVWISGRPDTGMSEDDGDPIAVGDREGRRFEWHNGATSLSVPDEHGGVIHLLGTDQVELDDLIDLALAVDTTRPWADQQLGPGWTVLGVAERGVRTSTRAWELRAPDDPTDPQPGGRVPPAVWVITHTDTDMDPVMLHDSPERIRRVRVRGTTGTVTAGPPGYYAVVVWEEAPGVYVRLRYGPSDDPVADAVEYADALVAVDTDRWQEFSDAHDGAELVVDG